MVARGLVAFSFSGTTMRYAFNLGSIPSPGNLIRVERFESSPRSCILPSFKVGDVCAAGSRIKRDVPVHLSVFHLVRTSF